MAGVDQSRADAHEEDAVISVLGMKLANSKIQSALADGVRRANIKTVLVGEINVRHTRGDGDDFLGISLNDKGHVEVEEMNIADDIDPEALQKVFFQLFGSFATVNAIC